MNARTHKSERARVCAHTHTHMHLPVIWVFGAASQECRSDFSGASSNRSGWLLNGSLWRTVRRQSSASRTKPPSVPLGGRRLRRGSSLYRAVRCRRCPARRHCWDRVSSRVQLFAMEAIYWLDNWRKVTIACRDVMDVQLGPQMKPALLLFLMTFRGQF